MTKEEAKLVLDNARPQTKEVDKQFYDDEDLNNALNMAIKALEQCEVWNGTHGQIIAPKGTFDKIWEDAEKEEQEQYYKDLTESYEKTINKLTKAISQQESCKDCKHCRAYQCGYACYENHWGKISKQSNYGGMGDFYCADFEKRGVENE